MLAGINILAVDDDRISLEMLSATLGDRGAYCIKAVNGREALDILTSNSGIDIDIVLLDLQMPVMDGFELLAHCKNNPRFSHIPIIVLAANHYEKLKALQHGAEDFISKPYNLEELELRISRLVQLRRQAQAAKQAKREFLAIASHELRTPIHQIMGLGELLDGEKLSGEQQQFFELLKCATANLADTVNSILRYTNLNHGEACTTAEPFSLRTMVKNTLESLEVAAARKGIKLGYSMAADISDSLLGSSCYIRRVFIILLENAIKFSPDGEINVVIREESCEKSASRFYCSISDQGIGIPAEFHEKIFEPFVQVDSTNARKFGGIGLGLAIALRLAEQLGGTITVQNNEGKGCAFNFSFYCQLEDG